MVADQGGLSRGGLLYYHFIMMFNAIGITKEESSEIKDFNTPAHCLRLLGRSLNLTARLYAKKFRYHGYKKGALTAFQELESAGLGTMKTIKNKGFVVVTILMLIYHKISGVKKF